MQTIKTAIIGMGGRGRYFSNMYSSKGHPGFDLVAVCDRDPATFKFIENNDFPDVTCHTDMAEMLKMADIDAVLVATHDADHTAPALAALAASKHVLVEKPLCQNLAEAQHVLQQASRRDQIFMMGFELREVSVFANMKKMLEEGKIGDIKVAHSFDNVSVGGNYYFHCLSRQREYMKSLLLQKGCHSLDLLNWLIGSHPVKVYATGGCDVYGGDPSSNALRCRDCDRAKTCNYYIDYTNFEMDYGENVRKEDYCVWNSGMDLNDNSELCISYASGVKATYHEVHFTPDYSREFWLVGTKGKMYGYYDNPGRFQIRIEYTNQPGQPRTFEEYFPPKKPGAHGGGDNTLRDEFYRRIIENDPSIDVLESAYYSTALAICAEESIDSGMPVDIPELPL